MSGIYISGMEMPTSCWTCFARRDVDIGVGIADGCDLLKTMIYNPEERLDNCPLVHVPEHGWIPVTEKLPECDLGAEVGNIEWICCGMVHAGCFGRGGKYRDAYFRTWTDAGEGMDAKDADYWRLCQIPAPPKEET